MKIAANAKRANTVREEILAAKMRRRREKSKGSTVGLDILRSVRLFAAIPFSSNLVAAPPGKALLCSLRLKKDGEEAKVGTDVDWEGEPAFAKPLAGQAGLRPLIDEQKTKA